MKEHEKLLAWLDISAYPEQAECLERFIAKYNKILNFIEQLANCPLVTYKKCDDYPAGYVAVRNEVYELCAKFLLEIGEE